MDGKGRARPRGAPGALEGGRYHRPVSGKRGKRRGAPPDEQEPAAFRAEMSDVQRLDGPDPVLRRRRPRRGPAHPAAALGPEPVRFEVERIGHRIAALAPGTDGAVLGRLRGGEIAPDLTLDLHGFPEIEARGMVRDTLRRARRTGLHCVKVIHGRGLRSGGEAVLKEALPEWLAEPPLGSWVAAFASAPSRHGGPGSTLVLLRS